MRIVIAGGTGLIGTALTGALADAGHEVVVLTRRPPAEVRGLPRGARAERWDPASPGGWAGALAAADAVVNLAGASIGTPPWTAARRREIMDSRLRATSGLAGAMRSLPADARPKALVSASGVDYYGERGDEALDEGSARGGGVFLAEVCARWEAAAMEAEPLGVRVVLLRTGLVLARAAPALRLMALPFRLFAGGRTGSGRQWVSWVHLADVVGLYSRAAADPAVRGPLNAVAPGPVRNAELAAEIGRALHRPVWLPQPAPVLRLALGRQSQLLLVSRRVLPRVALDLGYEFRYPALPAALAEALGRSRQGDDAT
ncbi:MAG TPA: TIGR01777 family oxidoreductase [Candidatus Eisenbacteria bacterium]|nr:TIGR01777 family oxidoreductase [Candidatus Eisenbacteria bacterium]